MFAVELWVDQPGHLLGTARMGDDPGTLGRRPLRSQPTTCPNLFVADGSMFVTSGSANPTCTISALALRVARGIADNARDSGRARMTPVARGTSRSRTTCAIRHASRPKASGRRSAPIADASSPERGPGAERGARLHRWLDAALAARADAFETIVPSAAAVARAADAERLAALRGTREDRPRGFHLLSGVVAGAYLMLPEMRRGDRLSRPGQRIRRASTRRPSRSWTASSTR